METLCTSFSITCVLYSNHICLLIYGSFNCDFLLFMLICVRVCFFLIQLNIRRCSNFNIQQQKISRINDKLFPVQNQTYGNCKYQTELNCLEQHKKVKHYNAYTCLLYLCVSTSFLWYFFPVDSVSYVRCENIRRFILKTIRRMDS